jgi:hypothetical protein
VLDLVTNINTPDPIQKLAITTLEPNQADYPEILQMFQSLLPGVKGEAADRLREALTGNP